MSVRSNYREQPESLVHRLVARRRRHVLWDSLLVCAPPVLAFIYTIVVLLLTSWLSAQTAIFAVSAAAILGGLAFFLRRPRAAGVPTAARLLDRQAGAKDHFLTLTTVDPVNQSHTFLAHLRRQAGDFTDSVNLKRDFPYHPKPSAYWSFAGSLLIASLVHLLLPLGLPGRDSIATPERLRELAQQMAGKADLRTLAKDLEALAAQFNDPKLSLEEKRVLAQKLEEKIREQREQTEKEADQDLLAQAATALKGEDQQPGGNGAQDTQQQKGAGGIQSNARREGQGQNKQNDSGSGDDQGESGAQLSQGVDQGKGSKTNSPEHGQERNPAGGEKNSDPPTPDQPGTDPRKSEPGKTQVGAKEGGGKQQASAEPPPQGGTPAERFFKPGEGREGLKGAGYVTVQLPEEVVADSKGESRSTNEPQKSPTRTKVPVSNVPLPAHLPNAPTEKQPVPLEYRGILR